MSKIIIKEVNNYKTRKGDLLFRLNEGSSIAQPLVISSKYNNLIEKQIVQDNYLIVPSKDIIVGINSTLSLNTKKYQKIKNILKIEFIEDNQLTKNTSETPTEIIIENNLPYIFIKKSNTLMFNFSGYISIINKKFKIFT